MAISQIKNIMSEINLKGMLMSLDQTLKEATSESWGYTDLLDVLLQSEYDHREKRKIESRLRRSKLKRQASFEDFDFTAKRTITKAQVKELRSLRWLEQSRPVLLMGPTGVGKTFLAEAIGLYACHNKHTVLFHSVSTFFENLMLARSAGNYLTIRDRMIKPKLLILDDFGLRKLTKNEPHDLCEILEERSQDKSTLITTQLPFEHWSEVIEDPVIAEAIVDRLKHTSIKIIMQGQSYRMVKGLKLDQQKLNG